MNITKTIAGIGAAAALVAYITCAVGCVAPERVEVTREVPVTTQVQVTQEVEVTREVHIDRMVPVTREVEREIPVEVTREVPVTRQVQVTHEVPVTRQVEVTRQIPVTRQVEITREVPVTRQVQVTREVPVTREIPVTRQIEVTRAVEVTRQVPMPQPWSNYKDHHELSAAAITVAAGGGTGWFNLREGKYYGHVFTNEHVVRDREDIRVYWHPAGKGIQAKPIISDINLDIAVLDVTLDDFLRTYDPFWEETVQQALEHMERIGRWGSKDIAPYDAVWMAGYPRHRNPNLMGAPEVRTGGIYDIRKTIIGGYENPEAPPLTRIAHSIWANYGSSGSLIINGLGHPIGIESYWIPSGQRDNWIPGTLTDPEGPRGGIATTLWEIYDWIDGQ